MINGNWVIVKINVIGRMPNTLKFTHISVDCVLQIISFKIARAIKKPIQRFDKICHPKSSSFRAEPNKYFHYQNKLSYHQKLR